MGCCGTNQTMKYRHELTDRSISKKDCETIKKWGCGALARRRFKKIVQTKMIASQRKPVYHDGVLIATNDLLMTDDDLAYQMAYQGGGKGLYWNTIWVDIGQGRNYQGQWIANNNRKKLEWSGLGTIVFADGSKYQGMTSNGKFDGVGRMTHSNGDVYQGEWKDGMACGQGVFIDTKGSMYDGEWLDDAYHGKGTEQWNYNKIVYKGDFANGLKTGQGKFEFDGNLYEGDFVDGQFHGKGKYFFAETGKIYEGDFLENKIHGSGLMLWTDGTKYQGEYRHGKMEGHGVKHFENGDIYTGQWQDDQMHGRGSYFNALQLNTVDGEWRDGEHIIDAPEGGTPWRTMRKITVQQKGSMENGGSMQMNDQESRSSSNQKQRRQTQTVASNNQQQAFNGFSGSNTRARRLQTNVYAN